jgi:hypothetical protein
VDSPTLALEHNALLVAAGIPALPQPIPAGALTLPLFRAAVKLPKAGPDGMLPESAWRTQVVVAESSADRVVLYEITGHPKLGLPYGSDGDVMLAVMALADGVDDATGRPRVNPMTGEFLAPSANQILGVLGLSPSGQQYERVRAALARLAFVRIAGTRLRRLDEAPAHLEPVVLNAGNALTSLTPPSRKEASGSGMTGRRSRRGAAAAGQLADVLAERGGGTWIPEVEKVDWLLAYEVRREFDRRITGESWISKLQINPALLAQGEHGWVGWVDCRTHAALNPVAKRLYQLVALATARQAALRFDVATLRQLCGMAERKPAEIRDDLLRAAHELQAHDIIEGAEAVSPRRGQYALYLTPGLRLRVAGWLRGVGTLDLTERRVQRMLLASCDVAPATADRLVRQAAGRVHQMLAVVLYRRDRNRPVQNPARYIEDGVAQGWSYETNADFQQWLQERTEQARTQLLATAAGTGSRVVPPVRVSTPPAVWDGAELEGQRVRTGRLPVVPPTEDVPPAERAIPLPTLPTPDESVLRLWNDIVMTVGPSLHALPRDYLAHTRPVRVSGWTLLTVSRSDLEAQRLAREVPALSAAAAVGSGGSVREVLVLSPALWTAREKDLADQIEQPPVPDRTDSRQV